MGSSPFVGGGEVVLFPALQVQLGCWRTMDECRSEQQASDDILDRVDQTQDDHGTRLDAHATTLHNMAISIRRLEVESTDLRHRLSLFMLVVPTMQPPLLLPASL